MNKNELNDFELWVLKKRSIWFHIIVGYLTCFVWVVIYFYCKIKSDRINKIKIEKLKQEKEELLKRKNREKTKLIFDKRLKVLETSHPKRQKILKIIYTILENNDTPNILASISNKSIDLFYCDIDDDFNEEQPIGIIKEYVNEIKQYYDNPDYEVKLDYEIEEKNEFYSLYVIIKIYN